MAEQSYLKIGLIAVVAVALGLSACSTSDATTGSVVTDFDSASTAQRFGHADAIGAELGEAPVRVFRKVVFLVPLCGVGPELGLGEGAHGLARF